MNESTSDDLRRELESWGVSCPEGWSESIDALFRLLVEANSQTNLTRITERDDFLFKHVADSLLVARAFPRISDCSRLADVGCGAGFPGIPLALTFPDIEITEIDSVAKKIDSVSHFITTLGIRGSAVQGRARELARRPEHHERFDVVTARAVAEAGKLIKECHRLLAPEGSMILYKTPTQLGEELEVAEREARKVKLALRVSRAFELPNDVGTRQFLIARRG